METQQKTLLIPVGHEQLHGDLSIPREAVGLVLFAHGSGSSRFSPRNRFVAQSLNHAGLATLLADLLTEDEDAHYASRFNINLLTDRLIAVTQYVMALPETADLALGYFGASTGAACALSAAARLPASIRAVVSRGGRPDLAASALARVKAPTLLLVGSLDTQVITLNKRALNMLTCEKQIMIVQGASHLFEEPGKLDEVALLARTWFLQHLHPAHAHLLTH